MSMRVLWLFHFVIAHFYWITSIISNLWNSITLLMSRIFVGDFMDPIVYFPKVPFSYTVIRGLKGERFHSRI